MSKILVWGEQGHGAGCRFDFNIKSPTPWGLAAIRDALRTDLGFVQLLRKHDGGNNRPHQPRRASTARKEKLIHLLSVVVRREGIGNGRGASSSFRRLDEGWRSRVFWVNMGRFLVPHGSYRHRLLAPGGLQTAVGPDTGQKYQQSNVQAMNPLHGSSFLPLRTEFY